MDFRDITEAFFESRFTKFYESYWLYDVGFDVRKVQYSSLILTGQMTREEALDKLNCKPYTEEYSKKNMNLFQIN